MIEGIIDTMREYVDARSPLMIEAKRRRTPKEFLAYVLATAWYEPGYKLVPVTESLNYSAAALRKKKKYFTSAQAEKYGRTRDHPADQEMIANIMYANRIGNGDVASGDGWRFRGRGFPQLTGRSNYSNFSGLLGVDLVGNPDLACDPSISVQVLFEGILDGHFTGKGLRAFIKPGVKKDYVNARRVVNHLDKADLIAGYADDFEELLTEIGYNPAESSRTVATADSVSRGTKIGTVVSAGVGVGGAVVEKTGGLAASVEAVAGAILGDTGSIVDAAAMGAQLGEFMPYLKWAFPFALAGLFVWLGFRVAKIKRLRKEDAEAGR